MDRISSFSVDHDYIIPGVYISRIDGDIITYDLRTRRPNCGDYMDNLTMHSVEHLFATFIRNGELSEHVIYFGPMGCQTGFYLLMRGADPDRVYDEVVRILNDIISFDGEMPGSQRKECGNYRNLDVNAARTECSMYLAAVTARGKDFKYPEE